MVSVNKFYTNVKGSKWKIVLYSTRNEPVDWYGITSLIGNCRIGFNLDLLNANERLWRTVITHELIHAFLYECGLVHSAGETDCWALNEEMVDWFAHNMQQIIDLSNELYSKIEPLYKKYNEAPLMVEIHKNVKGKDKLLTAYETSDIPESKDIELDKAGSVSK